MDLWTPRARWPGWKDSYGTEDVGIDVGAGSTESRTVLTMCCALSVAYQMIARDAAFGNRNNAATKATEAQRFHLRGVSSVAPSMRSTHVMTPACQRPPTGPANVRS